MPAPRKAKPAKAAAENEATQPISDTDARAAMALHGDPVLAPSPHEGDLGLLGPYRVMKKVGLGGMGLVYLGFDESLHRKVALKVMLPKVAVNKAAKERFLREARAAAAVEHPNVVAIYSVGEHAGIPFLAMQYLQGAPLDKYLNKKGPPTLSQILRVGRETAEGLAAAHARGLIHRDIKPANLWLEAPNGHVKILDFGLAKPQEEGGTEITQSGAVVGTPAYMAPEQARALPVDARTDLFSLGAVLYRLCTGQQPFTGPTVMAVLSALALDAPKPVREVNPAIPQALEDLILKLLEKDPNRRPKSAAEVVTALKAIEKGAGAPPPTVTPLETPHLALPGSGQMLVIAEPESAFAHLDEEPSSPPSKPKDPSTKSTSKTVSMKKPLPVWVPIACGAGFVAMLAVGAVLLLNQSEKKPPETDEAANRRTAVTPKAMPFAGGPVDPKGQPLSEKFLTAFRNQSTENQKLLLERELQRRHPDFEGTINVTIEEDAIVGVDIKSAKVTDLIPFKALPTLKTFTYKAPTNDGGPLTDLSPLEDLPLKTLILHGHPNLTNFAPLKKMPLSEVRLSHTGLSDLAPLAGKTLNVLSLVQQAKLTTLAPLAGTPVGELYVHATGVTDLAPVAGSGVKVLSFGVDRVKDLSPLKDAPLERIFWEPLHVRPASDLLVPLRESKTLAEIQRTPAKDFWAVHDLRRKASQASARSLQAHDGEVHCVAWSRDGKRFATGGQDGKVKLWNAETFESTQTLKAPGPVHRMEFIPGTDQIVAQCGNKLAFWNVRTGEPEGELIETPVMVSALTVSPDGSRLLAVGWQGDHRIYQWTLPDRTPLEPIANTAAVLAASISRDNRHAILAGQGRRTWVWDLQDGKPVFQNSHNAKSNSVAAAFAPDEATILHADEEGLLARIDWRAKTETPMHRLYLTSRAVFHPKGTHVVAGSRDGWLSVVDYRSGELLMTANGASNVRGLAFSPDGRTLLSVHFDGNLRVWSFESLLKKN